MILELHVENIAIIERSSATLGSGFTAFTGETGAGKSLLIDALQLALGGRGDSDLVRTGATRGTVSLSVDLSSSPAVLTRCEELGAAVEDQTLFIQREVSAEGRSTCRIGGRLTPVSVLRELGEMLVDLHGQHDHQALFNVERHLDYLDAWIGAPAQTLLSAVREKHGVVEDLRRKRSQLQANQRDRAQRIDLLRFQVQEIESAGVVVGEFEELSADLTRYLNAAKILEGIQGALQHLDGEDSSTLNSLSLAVRQLESSARFEPQLEEPLSQTQSSVYILSDVVSSLRAYADSVDLSPEMLDTIQDRLEVLKKLRRKYGDTEEAILAQWDEAAKELELLENADISAERVNADLADAEAELHKVADELSSLRTTRAAEFAKLAQDQLRDLAMDKAIFEVRIQEKPCDVLGKDMVEFYFSSNVGESAKPLNKIASGGEISRVMLGLKVILAGRAGVHTLIFDEVDTGLSGRAAAVVAKKLEQLSEHYQVIAISHLPQIAGRALHHFRIEKNERNGRMVTDVRELSDAERVTEIARMLAGEQVGESALANARDLLKGRVELK